MCRPGIDALVVLDAKKGVLPYYPHERVAVQTQRDSLSVAILEHRELVERLAGFPVFQDFSEDFARGLPIGGHPLGQGVPVLLKEEREVIRQEEQVHAVFLGDALDGIDELPNQIPLPAVIQGQIDAQVHPHAVARVVDRDAAVVKPREERLEVFHTSCRRDLERSGILYLVQIVDAGDELTVINFLGNGGREKGLPAILLVVDGIEETLQVGGSVLDNVLLQVAEESPGLPAEHHMDGVPHMPDGLEFLGHVLKLALHQFHYLLVTLLAQVIHGHVELGEVLQV